MVSESRYLVFSNEELIGALSAIMLFRGEQAPENANPIVTFDNGEGVVHTTLTYIDADNTELGAFSFNADEIGAALIHFCIQSGIPLPKQVEKTIELKGDNVSLALQVDSGRSLLSNPVHVPEPNVQPDADGGNEDDELSAA